MRCDRQKNERQSLKLYIAVWVLLIGYLLFYTWKWDITTPFLTIELLGPWIAVALLWGVLVAVSEWDSVFKPRNLQLLQAPGFGLGFLAYILFFLAFNTGVFLVLLYSLEGAMSRLYPNAGTDPLMILPSIGQDGNRYLFLACFIALTIVQIFSVSKLLARWFSTTMESWLNLPNPPTPSEEPYNPPPQEPKEEHTAMPKALHIRATVQPDGKVEVDVVVNSTSSKPECSETDVADSEAEQSPPQADQECQEPKE